MHTCIHAYMHAWMIQIHLFRYVVVHLLHVLSMDFYKLKALCCMSGVATPSLGSALGAEETRFLVRPLKLFGICHNPGFVMMLVNTSVDILQSLKGCHATMEEEEDNYSRCQTRKIDLIPN